MICIARQRHIYQNNYNMKHLFYLAIAVILGFCNITNTYAQDLPVDPDVRVGKLDNGLTYYIRNNKLPENRADFYIAQKVGSIQEEPNQRGLAHFLEHMAFNGTTHFPGDALKQYLETIGVKFGENLNAYTSIDETVYNISNVPVTREGVIDSCLLILHDWSNDLLLEPKEIDKERGVIEEEWRSRMSAMQRLQEKALPQMFAGTRYADCLPIGSMDVVRNFEYQTLRDYYEKWYRPDLQGIMIVGDINVDEVENKIRKMFSDIPAQPDAAERIYYPVNDNEEPIIVIEQDKEQPNIQVLYFNKHEAYPDDNKETIDYLVINYAKSLMGDMISARLNELRQTAEPPFIHAGAYDGMFFAAKTKDSFTGYAVCKEDDITGGFETLAREIERLRRFGFTETEYARARAEYLRHLESEYNERDKKKNNSYIGQYVSNFLDNEPIPGVENEYAILSQIAPTLTVENINSLIPMLISENNKVVLLFGPEKEGLVYPTKEEMRRIIDKVSTEELTPYEDKVSDEPLISQKPVAGKIVSEKQNDVFGTTSFVLSNGLKIYVKQTDYKADEIRMKGFSMGGNSLFPDSEIANIMTLNSVINAGGVGNFSAVELEKVLAGKKAHANAIVGSLTESVSGSCSPKDLETMLQLAYLKFTSPRKDEEAFTSYKNRTKASLQNQELHPMVSFVDSINYALYGNHPRAQRLKADMIDRVDYDKILEMYKDRFKDASDFTFIFIGNIDIEEAKPLFEEYLGSLPSVNRKETFRDTKLEMRKGNYKNEFIKVQENPKASVFGFYNGTCDYTPRNLTLMSFTDQILTLIYTEKVREEEGGTYGVSVNGSLSKYPKEEFSLEIVFDTDPAKKEKLMGIIFGELEELAKNGPSEENLNKAKEYMLKKYQENIKENGYWLGIINEYLFTGTNIDENYINIVQSITAEDIKQFVYSLLSQGNKAEVTMISPEKE